MPFTQHDLQFSDDFLNSAKLVVQTHTLDTDESGARKDTLIMIPF